MQKQLPLLLGLTLVVVFGAFYFYGQNEPVQNIKKEILFPDLKNVLNDINKIFIKGYENQIDLVKQENNWFLKSHDNHPALFDDVKKLIIQISDLKILAEKTDNPELYSRLNVEGPENGRESIQITLTTDNGDIFALIVGKKKQNEMALPSLYVRVQDQQHALHVEGVIDAEAVSSYWFDNDLADIPAEAIRDVSISHPGKPIISLTRSMEGDNNFELETVPEGRNPTSQIVLNRLGRILEELQAIDVRQFEGDSESMVETQLTSFDGMQITIRANEIDGKPFANFHYEIVEAERDEETEKAIHELVPRLNEKYSQWFYQIPEFKYTDITIGIEKLLRPRG